MQLESFTENFIIGYFLSKYAEEQKISEYLQQLFVYGFLCQCPIVSLQQRWN